MKKLLVLLLFLFSIIETYSQNGYEKAIELGGSLGVGTYSNNANGGLFDKLVKLPDEE